MDWVIDFQKLMILAQNQAKCRPKLPKKLRNQWVEQVNTLKELLSSLTRALFSVKSRPKQEQALAKSIRQQIWAQDLALFQYKDHLTSNWTWKMKKLTFWGMTYPEYLVFQYSMKPNKHLENRSISWPIHCNKPIYSKTAMHQWQQVTNTNSRRYSRFWMKHSRACSSVRKFNLSKKLWVCRIILWIFWLLPSLNTVTQKRRVLSNYAKKSQNSSIFCFARSKIIIDSELKEALATRIQIFNLFIDLNLTVWNKCVKIWS